MHEGDKIRVVYLHRPAAVDMKGHQLLATAALFALLLAQTVVAKQTLKVGVLVPGSGEDCAVGLQHWYMAQYATQYVQNESWWPSDDLTVRVVGISKKSTAHGHADMLPCTLQNRLPSAD